MGSPADVIKRSKVRKTVQWLVKSFITTDGTKQEGKPETLFSFGDQFTFLYYSFVKLVKGI
jgi:hypothetical protein